MQNKNYTILIFVVGIAVGIIGWNILMLGMPTPVYAEATSGSSNGLIAVTGMCTNNTSCLWVIDTRDSKNSPSLCMYLPENSGRSFKLAAARTIKWDLQMMRYNDTTDSRYTPGRLRDELEKINEQADQGSKKNK